MSMSKYICIVIKLNNYIRRNNFINHYPGLAVVVVVEMVVSSISCGGVTSINVLDLVMVTGRVVVDLELGIRLSIEDD